jgi:hypothetical protein
MGIGTMAVIPTHFAYRIDLWSDDEKQVVEHLADVGDLTVVMTIFAQRALRWQSIILAHFLTAFLDVLRFFLIQAGEFVARLAHYMEHFVELGMDSLRVAMLRALNDQGHEPSRHGRPRVPLEGFGLVQPPKRAIAEEDQERERARHIAGETSYDLPHERSSFGGDDNDRVLAVVSLEPNETRSSISIFIADCRLLDFVAAASRINFDIRLPGAFRRRGRFSHPCSSASLSFSRRASFRPKLSMMRQLPSFDHNLSSLGRLRTTPHALQCTAS